MVAMQLLRPHDYARTRWKNDGGWTTEIASAKDPDSPCGFRWRVSIAEIESDGPFSSFPGIERDLLLLSGSGMELDINDAPAIRMERRFQHIHFAGEDRVMCRLLAGPTRDFNVMCDRSSTHAEVHARPLIGTMLVFAEPGASWLVHVLGGSCVFRGNEQSIAAESGDTTLIESTAHQRIVIEGSGELILVKFTQHAPD
jgi:environmental stress-induced protein Ves